MTRVTQAANTDNLKTKSRKHTNEDQHLMKKTRTGSNENTRGIHFQHKTGNGIEENHGTMAPILIRVIDNFFCCG